ncbi:lysophospholipid acyltransferase family protein [Campylobacter sp.]|uniref:lysophospholipid acyltransferase family protein n=1 Tax=Campylobacter sp. TaxID=205 RepID=UPI0026FFB3A1|nr:lysophospholipid acyltransferase family protein [Campylobacter sp.]
MASWWAKFKRAIFINFTTYAIYFLIWLIFLTCKKTYSKTNLEAPAHVVLFWHGRIAMMSFAYLHWWGKFKRHGKVIISDHKDGEIIARVIKFFGIGTIRGSSSKGGAKALINAFKEIKAGNDVIITPDGPRGPCHSVADGAVIIAQKQNVNIQILNYEASKFWQFKSWDKMILPKPFSTINFTLSQPFSVANLSLDDAKILIKKKMRAEDE